MAEITGFSGWGLLAKVISVGGGGRRVYIQLPDGRTGWADSPRPVQYEVGTVVLVLENSIELAPIDAWRQDSWVAVVRIKLPDVTVVESGGSARMVPTREVPYEVGNTVEVMPDGVARVLDGKPLRYLDLPEFDGNVVESLIVPDTQLLPSYADFGGMSDVVERARELVETPLKHQEALARIGARPVRGVLFTGLPGTGKTMLARVIAREANATFYQVSGPEIISKWFGQSEQLLRALFEDARRRSSAIIFFDEIDSIASHRDEDAHEASKRLVAQLLTLMDGFTEANNVVVIAATNRPEAIDSALRRPGRFDWEIRFELPNFQDREKILIAAARQKRRAEGLPHHVIAEKSDGWTSADLAAVWTEAAILAANDNRDIIMAEDYIGGFERVEAQRRRVQKR